MIVEEQCVISPIRTLEEYSDNKVVIHKWLRKALEKAPENDLSNVLKMMYNGESMLWLTRDEEEEIIGVTVVQVLDYPQQRNLLVELLGGKDITKWVHLIKDIEDWGRDMGCVASEITGRPAWKKLLTDYTSDTIVYNKALI